MKRNLKIFIFVGIPIIFFLMIVGGRLDALNYPTWLIGLVVSIPQLLMVVFLFILPILKQHTKNTFWGQGKEAKRIIKTGRKATATVLHIGESSEGGTITINDQPYLNLKFLVDDGKSKPYEISLNTIIPRISLPQFQPGVVFNIKIDPHNKKKIVLAK